MIKAILRLTRAPRHVSASKRGIQRKIAEIAKLSFLPDLDANAFSARSLAKLDQDGTPGQHGPWPDALCGFGQQAPIFWSHLDAQRNGSLPHGQ
jgi:hypothetical protein